MRARAEATGHEGRHSGAHGTSKVSGERPDAVASTAVVTAVRQVEWWGAREQRNRSTCALLRLHLHSASCCWRQRNMDCCFRTVETLGKYCFASLFYLFLLKSVLSSLKCTLLVVFNKRENTGTG